MFLVDNLFQVSFWFYTIQTLKGNPHNFPKMLNCFFKLKLFTMNLLSYTASLQAVTLFESRRWRCVCPSVCRHQNLCGRLRLWTGNLVLGPGPAPTWASVVTPWKVWSMHLCVCVCVCVWRGCSACSRTVITSEYTHTTESTHSHTHTRTQLLPFNSHTQLSSWFTWLPLAHHATVVGHCW